jgi:phosphate transport system substrate-binding protein
MRRAHLAFLLSMALMLRGAPAGAGPTLKIGGTGGALGTMGLLADAYARENPAGEVEILPSLGSGGSIKALATGFIDIGVVSRPLEKGEKAFGLKVEEFARTPFVFITHRSCNVADLTTDKLIGFYSGATEICPCGSPLRLVLRPAKDSDILILKSISSGMARAVETALARPGMLIAVTDQEAASAVTGGVGRVGTSTLALVLSERRNVNLASFNGNAPTVDSLREGTYPLSKTFSVVSRPHRSPEVTRFISFLKSGQARKVLEENGSLHLAGEPAGQ